MVLHLTRVRAAAEEKTTVVPNTYEGAQVEVDDRPTPASPCFLRIGWHYK